MHISECGAAVYFKVFVKQEKKTPLARYIRVWSSLSVSFRECPAGRLKCTELDKNEKTQMGQAAVQHKLLDVASRK